MKLCISFDSPCLYSIQFSLCFQQQNSSLYHFQESDRPDFCAKCQIMLGWGGGFMVFDSAGRKIYWLFHSANSSVTHMVDFLQDFLFSVCISEVFLSLLDCLQSKHFVLVL
jgi:hypothetical protein